MQYLYSIAGLKILCEIPFTFQIQQEAKEFLHPIYKDAETLSFMPDLKFIIAEVSELPPVEKDAFFTQDRYYHRVKEEMSVHYCPAPGIKPYACVQWRRNEKVILCQYLCGKEGRIAYSRCISDLMGVETILSEFQGLLLHASFIRWKEKGILFSAPSGIGKSTQANLWKQYENAEILNGDRAGIRKLSEGWRAFGLPYAGSSGIYRNESASISMIVILEQAKENQIFRLSPGEAFQRLYPELTVHRWDSMEVKKNTDLLIELCMDVPIVLLKCLPDYAAVQLTQKALVEFE